MIYDLIKWLRNLSTGWKIVASIVFFSMTYVVISLLMFLLCGGEFPPTWLGNKVLSFVISTTAYFITLKVIWNKF
jgi:hypothetical protein